MRDGSSAKIAPTNVIAQGQAQTTDSPTATGISAPTAQNQSSVVNASSQSAEDAEAKRLQEEYMRAMFGAPGAPQGHAQRPDGMPDEDDPMMKMMQAMMAGMGGMGSGTDQDPTNPNSAPQNGFPFNAEDISKMTGIPSFLTGLFLPGPPPPPPTPEQIKSQQTWKILRSLLSILVALYTVFTVDKSITTFGQNPSAPATAQNPFLIFVMSELLLSGAKTLIAGQTVDSPSLKGWIQSGKEIVHDGAIVIFALGCYCWWTGSS